MTIHMRRRQALLAASLLPGAALAAGQAAVDEAMGHDGLQRIEVKGIELAYARPGATLAGYARVLLDPVEVAFDRSWDPTRPGSRIKLPAAEREEIRAGVARIVRDEFVAALQKADHGSSYPVVDAAGADVLRVRARIVDLYVTAPDSRSVANATTYALSAGRMTLVAEFHDSESGQLIARVVDRREARNTGQLTVSNRVLNVGEARSIASHWARILRKGLDRAHGIGKP